jgi:hypothetical protein
MGFAAVVDVPNVTLFQVPPVVVVLAAVFVGAAENTNSPPVSVVVVLVAVFVGATENTKPPPVSGGFTTDGIVDVRVAVLEVGGTLAELFVASGRSAPQTRH